MSAAGPKVGDLAQAEGLINRLLDDELSSGGAARLEQLLRESREARRFYILQMHLWCCSMPYALPAGEQADLAGVDDPETAAELSDAMILPAIREAAEPPELDRSNGAVPAPASPTRGAARKHWRRWGAAAAIGGFLVLGGMLGRLGRMPGMIQSPPAVVAVDPRLNPVPPSPPATLAAAVDAEWDDPNRALEPGSPMPSGAIVLKAGLAEIRFKSGVDVVVEAPAKFKIESDTMMRLDVGKLTAAVPVPAHGFTVQTASLKAVDLGTEFGVEVLPSQQSHVEVFKGSITAQATGASAAAATIRRTLSQGQAVAVSAGSSTMRSVAAKPLVFVRPSQMAAEAAQAADAGYQRWRAFSGALRDDPSLVAYYLFDNSAPETVPNHAPQTQGNLDGKLQPGSDGSRPAQAAGRWPEKPALRFNGAGGRVFVADDPALRLSGRATLLAWVRPDPGVRMKGYPRIIGKKQTFDASAGFDLNLARWESGGAGFDVNLDGKPKTPFFSRFPAPQVLDGQWHLLVGVVEGPAGFARGYLDGAEIPLYRSGIPSDIGAPGTLLPSDTGLALGGAVDAVDKHFFNGFMDEVAIFSRALSADEVAAAYRNGRP